MSRRRIVRFSGPRGELIAAESPNLVVYDQTGNEQVRTEVEDLVDAVIVGDELWAASPGRLTRLAAKDGRVIATEPVYELDAAGRFLTSSTAPGLPVWVSGQTFAIRAGANPAKAEVPGTGAEIGLPIADGRWLLWQGGQLRLWRSFQAVSREEVRLLFQQQARPDPCQGGSSLLLYQSQLSVHRSRQS